MERKLTYYTLFILLAIIGFQGCKQKDWLDEKRDKSQVRPETVKDFQAILDNVSWINGRFTNAGIAASNNVYLLDKDYATLLDREKQIYSWGMKPWDNTNGSAMEWDYGYAIIEYANIVLDGLSELKISGPEVENLKGQAYFYRAIGLYNLTTLFCRQYNPVNAGSEQGLPIRLTSDVNIIIQRSSLKATMDQVINDCDEAISKLDEIQSVTTRPSKPAAYALQAKIRLNNGDYTGALTSAENALKIKSSILDFNSSQVSLNNTYRFPANGIGNEEILFFAFATMNGNIVRPTTTTKGIVDSTLIKSYEDNDLRKTYFFIKSGTTYKFRGNYTGNFNNFSGLATNEVYLIKAECLARTSKTNEAISTLNTLLKKRYKAGKFVELTASSPEDAINLILRERRKELPFTGNIPWEDIRRLNLDQKRQTTLSRVINGQTITLTPNNARYALPIPDAEIRLSGIEQNTY
ncbi:RagB/SusD family nutrient uptake outer membrane protein [Sphingobacterium sp. DR205]|uniref:RagB/SusD family nutrient uptake outer membrane protein n=1 Tax=Sphingobacterium sp. DR205 TaxID=2713573 RepID=UPI0013E5100E|nr:RagB/SusD family nutrient uptake outer membrane protein [Sphingobacterium sp. DR205]QIH33501.1 RagB/SusD family nutrient uptake outer membrane protein [Sphingobacterium sp. DR205]